MAWWLDQRLPQQPFSETCLHRVISGCEGTQPFPGPANSALPDATNVNGRRLRLDHGLFYRLRTPQTPEQAAGGGRCRRRLRQVRIDEEDSKYCTPMGPPGFQPMASLNTCLHTGETYGIPDNVLLSRERRRLLIGGTVESELCAACPAVSRHPLPRTPRCQIGCLRRT